MEAEKIKNTSHMFKMRNKVRAVYEDIIHIYRTVQKALENLIHQLMEGTSIVPEAKWHPQPLKQAEEKRLHGVNSSLYCPELVFSGAIHLGSAIDFVRSWE